MGVPSKMRSNHASRRRIALLSAVGLMAAAAVGTATPALAQGTPGTGGGPVSASLNIPESIALTLNTTSITFTGTPGSPSSFPAVNYTINSNDAAGFAVEIASASANFSNGSGGTFQANSVDVWGPAQTGNFNSGKTVNGTDFTGINPASLTTAPATITTDSSTATGASTGTDKYGFVGPSVMVDSNNGPGVNIPSNVPSGTYTDTIAYSVFGN